MARPITQKDVKRWKGLWRDVVVMEKPHPKLGIIVYADRDCDMCAYSAYNNGNPKWVTKKTLQNRKRLGPPSKRKRKLLMQENMFSLDEMAIAEDIINRG